MAKRGFLVGIFNLISLSPALKRLSMRLWYQYLSRLDRGSTMIFMNYGYSEISKPKNINLKKADEKNRFCIQLYHHAVGSVNLKGLDVLEIGSGRGGGSSYIMRYRNPNSVTGIDFSKNAIEFCNRNYSIKGLSFCHGDAESLPFENRKFDVVVNVESSHCYADIGAFLSEVYRILKPNGYFLFADFRYKNKVNFLHNKLKSSGFKILKEKNITENVLKALDLGNKRKANLIRRKVPKIFQKTFLHFAGIRGSELYESFKTGKRDYYSFILQK